MTIDEIEAEISAIYRFWSEQAPGVTPQEVGTLAQLWSLADRHYLLEAMGMSEEEVLAEYGTLTLLERDLHG